MSTDWDVHCADCDKSLGLYDANHQEDLVFRLIAARDGLATLARSLEYSGLSVEVKADGFYPFDPSFFRLHDGHHLVARSEYGDVLEKPR